ncbi:MAG: maleylpyruvate isomerase N-terminal domain-containing protein [Streptosporangiaceae bacterium]
MPVESDPRKWIAVLRGSHERLAGLVRRLTPEQLRAQSYCSDWTNAQALSHLGSGAEIALLMLPGALGQAEPVDRDAFPPIWDAWNAKSPDEQAADALAADEQYVRALEELGDQALAGISLPFFGMDLDAVGLVRLRLGEHVLHTWDLEVFFDPAAAVAPEAVELLIDSVPEFLAPRLSKPQDEPVRVRIRTSDPARDYLLTAAGAVQVADWPADSATPAGTAEVSMSAEALLRLCYGRLDPGHTPPRVAADPAVLDRLRAVFPGF